MGYGGIFHDYLYGTWDEAKGYLKEELEQLRTALNNQPATNGFDNSTGLLEASAIGGDPKPATRYVANTGPGNSPFWDKVNLSNGVKGTLQFAFLPNVPASTLLGRGSTGGTGTLQSITLGPGLVMSGTELDTDTAIGKVRAATTANIVIASALNNASVLDGVTLSTGDFVLVKDQSTASENGIYTVGPSPSRTTSYSTFNELVGSFIIVEEGTTNADTLWLCTSDQGGTLGTTAVTFVRITEITTPGSSTDNAIVRFDGTSGSTIQNSIPIVDDDGRISTVTDPTQLQDVATKNYVDQLVATVTTGNSAAQSTFLVSGGQIVWQSAYTFLVSAATYYIDGILFNSAQQTITLSAADPTNDRIDVIAVDDTGTVVAITGTPSAQPSEPDVDPSTQLKLGIVEVPAGSTSPTVSNTTVYADDAGAPSEWNWTSSGTGWTLGSTNNPRSGTKDIEATTVSSGAFVQAQIGSGTLDPSTQSQLVIYIRSKATWGNNRTLVVSLRSSGVLVGTSVTVGQGTFGLDTSNTTSYQQVAIPITNFAIPAGSTINQIRLTRQGPGTIGFYLDDISFVSGGSSGGTTGGLTQAQADTLYAPIGAAFVTIGNNSTLSAERALTAGTGITLTDGGANSTATLALTNMSAATIKGRASGAGTGAPTDLTGTQATVILDTMVGDSGSGGTKGLVPAPASGDAAAGKFLKADGTWTIPAGGGSGTVTTTGTPATGELAKFSGSTSITNGDLSGDVSTSGTLVTTIANSAVTNAKLANMAAHTFKGNNTSSSASPSDLTATQLTAELNNVVGDSGSGGTKGLVPAPSAGDAAAGKFLKADGTWSITSISGAKVLWGVVFDGQGSAITNGSICYTPPIPWAGTIVGWRIQSIDDGAVSGSIVVDVWKDIYANYPPTVADTIAGTDKPTITSAKINKDDTLTGWGSTTVSINDIFGFHVDSITTLTRAMVAVLIQLS